MAKHLARCRLFVASADREYDETVYFEYRVVDGDLAKNSRWTVSGVDLEQPVSGIWDDVIAQVESDEGIV